MTDIQEPLAPAKRLLAGYIHEDEVAEERGAKPRALRAERLRGSGPPWIKISRQIYYSETGFRRWLESLEQSPARAKRRA